MWTAFFFFCCSKLRSLRAAGFLPFSLPYLLLETCTKARFLLPTVETTAVQGFGTAHNSVAVQLGHFWGGDKNKVKLKPQRDSATTVLSHKIISLSGRSKELFREDLKQETLGKHLQDDSDNARMFWLEQMVLCLPLVPLSQSSEGNHPFKWFAWYDVDKYFFPFSSQDTLIGQWRRETNFLEAFLVTYGRKDKPGLWIRGI